jgi:hypothetical protein
MTANSSRESAKIYKFPARGRFAADNPRTDESDFTVSRIPKTASGSAWYHEAWYHEEAIQDADRISKNK